MPSSQVCQKCHKEPTVVRTRDENFCKGCFTHFIISKQRKEMKDLRFMSKFGQDLAKIRASTPKVLAPLDFSASSLVAADILILNLEEQLARSDRAYPGFDLTFLCFNADQGKDWVDAQARTLRERYDESFLERSGIKFVVEDFNEWLLGSKMSDLVLSSNFEAYATEIAADTREDMPSLIGQLNDKSTREDILHVLTRKMVLDLQRQLGCSVLVVGDSMGEMAVSVLGLVARGKGAEVWGSVGSDKLPGGQDRIFILRDVLQSEVRQYAELCDLEVLEAPRGEDSTTKSIRNKTIDELIGEYFDSVAEDHPEIISTVVKMGDKLTAPGTPVALCSVCHNPIYTAPRKWLEHITVNEGVPLTTDEERANYARWAQAQGTATQQTDASGHQVPICYGCAIEMNTLAKRSLAWPTSTDEEIINELSLEED